MLLAGDLGGTKTLLGLFERRVTRPGPLAVQEFQTLAFPSLGSMVSAFLDAAGTRADTIDAACFGVAGPIHDEWADLTNVPWRIGAPEVREAVGLARVHLLNDVEALAHAVPALRADEMAVLHSGTPGVGPAALITVGTGFGQAYLLRVAGRPVPMPSEGGHADFAARTPREIALLEHLTARFGRVDLERVISGPGLANLADFTHGGPCPELAAGVDPASIPALVSLAAMDRRCARCEDALGLMIGALGSAAGNAAIMAVARGGVFIGGGIPAKILPALQGDLFLQAYLSKPPMEDLLAGTPVFVILNAEAGLLGAAIVAGELA
jgi:glucokinase